MIIGKKYKAQDWDRCGNARDAGAAYVVFNKLDHYDIFNEEGERLASCSYCLRDEDIVPYEEVSVGQRYRFVGGAQNCGACSGYKDPVIVIRRIAGKTLYYDILSEGECVDYCWGCKMLEAIQEGKWVLVEESVETKECQFKVGDRVYLAGHAEETEYQATVLSVNPFKVRYDAGAYSGEEGGLAYPGDFRPLSEPSEQCPPLIGDDLTGTSQSVGFNPSLVDYSYTSGWVGSIGDNQSTNQPKKTMSVTTFIKDQALKLSNPQEYALRKSGLHSECGDLTSDGKEALFRFLEEIPEVKAKLVQLASDINADNEKNDGK